MILPSFLDCLSDFFFYENKCHENASVIVGEMIADGVFKNKASIANQTLKSLFISFMMSLCFCCFQFEKKKKIQKTSFLEISFGFKSLLKMSRA